MISLLGLPQDNNSSFLQGPALAPARIREAIWSASANMTSELGVDLGAGDLWRDIGDVPIEGASGEMAYTEIYQRLKSLLDQGDTVLSLGGDHSVAFPVITAHGEKHRGLSVLQIDAHGDLYDDFDGNPYSHASPFARLLETGKIDRLVQVGIRTMNAHQREQVDRFGVEVHEMIDLSGVGSISFDGPFYLSLDLDGIDPAFAPGVSHHEPGGLSTRDVLNIIHTVKGTLIGADVVELNPLRDANGMTAMVAAKCAKELLARLITDAAA